MSVVEQLLDCGADIKFSDISGGSTPLDMAAKKGIVELVKLLFPHGAAASLTDYNNQFPRFVAVRSYHNEVEDVLNKRQSAETVNADEGLE